MISPLLPLLVSLVLALSGILQKDSLPAIASVETQEIIFVGSRHSNQYHYPTCRWVKRIKPENLIGFKSRGEAKRAGYPLASGVHPNLPLPRKFHRKAIEKSTGRRYSNLIKTEENHFS